MDGLQSFDRASAMQSAAADYIAQRLRGAIDRSGSARLLVSGGSSPRPVYEQISQMDLAWSRVNVGLVDERWLDPHMDGSNAAFISQTLLQGKASAANFIPMKTAHKSAKAAAATVSDTYRKTLQPIDICVMGMGLDGHTASWFPNVADLKTALDIDNPSMACAVDATGCQVAGQHTERMSLTLSAVMASAEIILLITGQAKRDVLDGAGAKSVYDAPVKALLAAGPRLKIFWGA